MLNRADPVPLLLSFGLFAAACSLVGFWADLGWLVLVYCERKILLVG